MKNTSVFAQIYRFAVVHMFVIHYMQMLTSVETRMAGAITSVGIRWGRTSVGVGRGTNWTRTAAPASVSDGHGRWNGLLSGIYQFQYHLP